MTNSDQSTSDEDDLLVGAPGYTSKISIWKAVVTILGLSLTGWLLLAPIPSSGWWALGVGFVVLIAMSATSESVGKQLARSYARELLSRADLEESDDNFARAEAVFNKRKSSNGVQVTLFLVAFLGLSACALWGQTDFGAAGFGDIGAIASLAWQSLLSILLVIASSLGAVSFALTDRYEEISFSPQTTSQTSTLALPVDDRNDIDIAGLGVALQAVMRRAESYTIESTLLSGLSFSAFIGIAFSDKGPIENASWINAALSDLQCNDGVVLGVKYCSYDLGPIVIDHVMFIVAGLMLVCAMLFMSAIIIRFQFNEAFRHTEEILAIARVLNEKESSATLGAKVTITQAITTYLEKAKAGFRDMSPLSSAMRMFRNLGVVSFTLAVATCGVYLHPFLFFVLIGIIVLAYFFTHVDNIRRKSIFLPQLESAVMSVFHKRI